ncbi:hypothetical protein SBV1_460028 [Verrucomicrobia bacterium]|nr:hypothetical protein SBV1_460028 [Verrucomicrobiota bacterium]
MRTAFFPAKTLSNLPAENVEALAVLCAEFERFDGFARQLPEHHNDYVEALSILKAFAMARSAKLEPFPEIGPQRHQNISSVTTYFNQLRGVVRTELSSRHARGYFESKTEEYVSLFSKLAVYEFSEVEFKRVHDLVNELRDLIRDSSLIAPEHKRRLLRKLEAMRGELYQKTSDIDRFWGFIGEAGIAMRKFGADLAPISDRVLELGGIVVGVIFSKEGIRALPEVSRMLLAHEA